MKRILLIAICLLAAFAAFAQSNTDKVRQFERLIGEWKSDGYSTGSEKYTQLKYMVSEGCKMNERVAKAYIDEFNATTIDIKATSWFQYIKEKRISITLRDLREKTGYDGKRIVYCYIKYTQPGKQDREDFVGFKIDGGKIFYICNDDMELANRLKEDSERQVVDNKPVQQQQPPATTGTDLNFTVSGVTFKMKYVQGGPFRMGSDDSDAYDNEKPVHTVTLSNDYYIGETEVTCGLWKAVMGSDPSYFKKGDNYPVENVSWDDSQEFIKKLNQKTGRTFRLPTEAEWEFAARGGRISQGYKYSGSNDINSVAVYDKNSYDLGSSNPKYGTHPVKSMFPNELGLYDMSGNVWEWAADLYKSNYYANSPSSNPQGPSPQSPRVLRGGSWDISARNCRVSSRSFSTPSSRYYSYGLRLALVP
jgi:formylglycine-generating enzyme required for sulfatase activity